MSKTRNINLRVSEEQLERIKQNAQAREMTLTEYVISRAVIDEDKNGDFVREIISVVNRYIKGKNRK